jgi:hypothetical protein
MHPHIAILGFKIPTDESWKLDTLDSKGKVEDNER